MLAVFSVTFIEIQSSLLFANKGYMLNNETVFSIEQTFQKTVFASAVK